MPPASGEQTVSTQRPGVPRAESQHWPRRSVLFAAVGAAAALLGCAPGPPASAVRVQLRLVGERRVGPAVIEAIVNRADGSPVSGATARVRGDMSHAGMTPVLCSTREVSQGRYLSEGFEFTMAGDWIITFEGTGPAGSEFRGTLDVKGVDR